MNPNEELDKLKKDLVGISQRVAEIQKEEVRLSKLAVCFDRDRHRWLFNSIEHDYYDIKQISYKCADCEVVVENLIPEGEWVSVHGDEEE